ncbi:MAG: mechanosensitive ion channel, partial [Gemmatimonadetes bacterium]|nr:mechanosensitive ion channel [Gemmatimonadota bacterium]
TLDQEDLIIPNSVLVSSTVKNYTLKDSLYRLRSVVGVTYDSDMKRVRKMLEETLRSIDWRDKTRDPIITMREFGSSSVDWEVSVFITNPFGQQQIRSKMNEAIWFALKEAGVVIAFPQLDLHLDAPVVKALQHRDGS